MKKLILMSAVLLAPVLAADKIDFNDGKERVEGVQISGDTFRRTEWRVGRNQGNAPWWTVDRMTLERSRGGGDLDKVRQFEENWSKAYGSRTSTNFPSAITAIEAALAMERPANYGDVDSVELRLRGFLAQARLGMAADPSGDVTKYLERAREVGTSNYAARGNVSPSGRRVTADDQHESLKPLNGLDLAHVHASAIDVYLVQARWHKSQGNHQLAFDAGYKPAAKLAEDAQLAFNEPAYIVRFAVPILREAAEMFGSGAAPSWKDSAEIYRRVENLARTVRDRGLEQYARLQGARANINQNQLADAERVYRDVLRPYEDGKRAAKPGDRNWDWLTAEKAALYAQAKNGYGLIRLAEKKPEEALALFVESLSFF